MRYLDDEMNWRISLRPRLSLAVGRDYLWPSAAIIFGLLPLDSNETRASDKKRAGGKTWREKTDMSVNGHNDDA